MKITISLANIPIEINAAYSGYLPLFKLFECENAPVASVSVSSDEIAAARDNYAPESTDEYIEYMELCTKVCDALLPHGAVIFHGAAFVWREKAWIFTAPSGTGKTTQYVLWKMLYKNDIRIINGDKPILKFEGDHIFVHPSPWTGKERMGKLCSAELGGIVLLKQSSENKIYRVASNQAVGSIFVQFLFGRENAEDVYKVCEFEEKLFNKVPMWCLENKGDRASATLCHDKLMEDSNDL